MADPDLRSSDGRSTNQKLNKKKELVGAKPKALSEPAKAEAKLDVDNDERDPAAMQLADRMSKNFGIRLLMYFLLAFLNQFRVIELKKAYACFINSHGISKFKKGSLIQGLASSKAFPVIYNLLVSGEVGSYIPVWQKLESRVDPPALPDNQYPWRAIYVREDFDGTYDNGRQFLSNWGIGISKGRIRSKFIKDNVPSSFLKKWKAIVSPELEKGSENIYAKLVEFHASLDEPVKQLLPSDFPVKASLVHGILHQFKGAHPEWSELDLEAKVYSIWHHFFGDFSQKADKVMGQLPSGNYYEGIVLYPDLIMENQAGVPCVIVENGVDLAVFEKHKDSIKVLAEGRLADTYTLSKFDTETAECFVVVNGGQNMSVVKMSAKMPTETLPDGSKRALSRSYSASFILDDEFLNGEMTGITVEYSLKNYTAIVQLFVAIFIASSRMQHKLRATPWTFTHVAEPVDNKKSQGQTSQKGDKHTPNKTPQNTNQQSGKSNTNMDKKASAGAPQQSTAAFPQFSKLKLKNHFLPVEVRKVERAIRELSNGLCGKVLPISKAGIPLEFDMQMSLDHPNILKIEELVYDDDRTYCMSVTPWIKDRIEMRRSAKENTMIAKGILDALNYLHDKGIVHADVKIGNVVAQMKDRRPQYTVVHAYLIDFGVSFYAKYPPHELRGTFPYIAPEVVQEGHCSTAMDMWSYGLMLFELFCGYFESHTREVDTKQLALNWYDNQPYKFQLVKVFFDLVMKCLENDPRDRITAKQALNHPFWAALERSDPLDPVVRFILGNEFNLEDPVDWATLAENESKLMRGEQKKRKRSLGKENEKNSRVKQAAVQTTRHVLGDITNNF